MSGEVDEIMAYFPSLADSVIRLQESFKKDIEDLKEIYYNVMTKESQKDFALYLTKEIYTPWSGIFFNLRKQFGNSFTFKQVEEANIIKASSISQDISEEEREEIMANAITEKYNLIDQTYIPDKENVDEDEVETYSETTDIANKLFGNGTGVLEQERLARLAKQQAALKSGPIRRR
jgi:uncharacterized protein YfkK (UPF0435 family)